MLVQCKIKQFCGEMKFRLTKISNEVKVGPNVVFCLIPGTFAELSVDLYRRLENIMSKDRNYKHELVGSFLT